MSTYEELHGKRVEVFSSDPTLDSSYEGQVWFNSTSGTLKTVLSTGAWVSATPASNGRSSPQGFGIQTAAVMAGGATSPGNQSYVEEYNGSGWTSGGAMPTTRQDGGSAGTETAGVVWCGEGPAKLNTTAEYNGTAWTVTNTYPITARGVRGSGTQTAALGCGGDTPAPAASNVSAEYDGSSWTAGNNLPGNRIAAATSGPQTSALATTGKDNTPNPSVSNLNTAYDGTNWTAQTVYPLSLRQAASTGTSSSANLVAGGLGATPFGDAVTTAAQWDGSSWTTTGSLGTKSTHAGYAGTSTSSLLCGGARDYPSYPGVTQEFNQSINTFTAAAWSSGGNLNLARHNGGNAGTKTAGLFFGGKVYPNVFKNESEEYDGTSWTEGNNLGTARMIAGAGTQTAGLGFGGTNGAPGSTGVQALTEEYDGSSWSENGDMSTARMDLGGAGLQTAAYAAGGIGSPNSVNDLHEQYNGSSWSTATAMNTESSTMGSVGTTTAGLVFGGYIPPSYAFATSSEEWNGSAWTSGGNLITARVALGGFGSQTDAIGFAGQTPPNNNSSVVEGYDGTAFSTRPSMAQARMQFSPSGSYNSGSDGMAVGGSNVGNPVYNNTEEWSAETTAVNVKTITTS